jgi:hypothetical protein
MSGGRIFDRPGYPPVDGPPPPGTVLQPLRVTRVAQAATAVILATGLLTVVPDIARLVVLPLAVLLAYRAYNAGVVRVEEMGLVLSGIFRTLTLPRERLDSVDSWFLRWRTSNGRIRRWQLWPYAKFSVVWPGVTIRSEEVMESLTRLVDEWKTTPPTE